MADDPEVPLARTTSFAKTTDREPAKKATSLRQEFDRAQTARTPSRGRAGDDRKTPEPDRTTSHSKNLDTTPAKPTVLRKQFDRAKKAAERVSEQATRTRSDRAHAPRHDPGALAQPRPKGLDAENQDRKTFKERQDKLAKAEAAMPRVAEQQQRMLDRERSRGR